MPDGSVTNLLALGTADGPLMSCSGLLNSNWKLSFEWLGQEFGQACCIADVDAEKGGTNEFKGVAIPFQY
jgi:hypothetical protein